MLRLFRNSRKTVYGTLIVGAAVIGMTSFGVSSFGGNSSQNNKQIAIKVGDAELSYTDYLREKSNAETYLRKKHGAQYELFLSLSNFKQEFTDSVIDKTAENSFINDSNLVSGKEELISYIKNTVFAGQPVSSQLFQMIAQSQGLTIAGLEDKLKEEVKRKSLADFLEQANVPSKKEITISVAQSLSSYDLNLVELSKSDFKSLVSTPTDEQLENFYQERLAEYELPERVRFVYSEVPQALAEKNIEILPDDIELYYAQHQEKFKNEKEVKADIITFKIPDGTLPDAVEKIREKAEGVKKEIDAGGSFIDLMVQYSDEKSQKVTKDGFLSKKDLSPELSKVLFSLEPGKTTDVIRSLSGFYIAKLNEVKEESYKSIDESRQEIINLIKTEQAPLLISQKALELAEKMKQKNVDLKTFAKEEGLIEPKESALISKTDNPGLSPLTNAVLENEDAKILTAEMNDKTYLIQVIERKEKEIPGFADVKEKVKATFEENELSKKFNEEVNSLKNTASSVTLTKLSQDKKLKLLSFTKISQKDSKDDILKSPSIQIVLFNAYHNSGEILGPVFQDNKAFILEIVKTTPPSKDELEKELKEKQAEVSAQYSQRLRASLIEKIKSEKEVVVDPMVYGAWN